MNTPEEYGYEQVKRTLFFKDEGPLGLDWACKFKAVAKEFRPTNADPEMICLSQWVAMSQAICTHDEESFINILMSTNPEALKISIDKFHAASKVDKKEWETVRKTAVMSGVEWKFTQNEDLANFLLSFDRHTRFTFLSEDKDLGSGSLDHEEEGDGSNLLGEAITVVHRLLWKKNGTKPQDLGEK